MRSLCGVEWLNYPLCQSLFDTTTTTFVVIVLVVVFLLLVL